MTSRRQFLISTATVTAAALTAPPAISVARAQPLRVEPRQRTLFLHHRTITDWDEAFDLYTDAPLKPRRILLRSVIDEVFDPDVFGTLEQPDHWRMIDADWFGGDDLDRLDDPERSFDPLVLQWHAWHKPTSEAYWLLRELFPEAAQSGGGSYIDAYDLLFVIHPCTPTLAEASLRNSWRIEEFAAELENRSPWLRLDPVPRQSGGA